MIVQIVRGRAPIASMDAMEDMDILTGSNPVINNGISTIIIIFFFFFMKIIIIIFFFFIISRLFPSTGPQHHPFIPGSDAVSQKNL